MVVISVLSAFESLELRRRVALVIGECEDVEVIGEAVNAVESVEQVTATRPDVVLIDAEMPHVTGIETARLLLGRGYSGAIIVVSNDVSQLEDALRSEGAGYLLKNCPADEMLGAIRQVLEGNFVFGGSVLKTPEGMVDRRSLHDGPGEVRRRRRARCSGRCGRAWKRCDISLGTGDVPTRAATRSRRCR